MDYETILTVRLDNDLATKFGEFRKQYSLNASDFVRQAIVYRMEHFAEMVATGAPTASNGGGQ